MTRMIALARFLQASVFTRYPGLAIRVENLAMAQTPPPVESVECADFKIKITIPIDAVKYVIGKGGQCIKRLQEMPGIKRVSVSAPRAAAPDQSNTTDEYGNTVVSPAKPGAKPPSVSITGATEKQVNAVVAEIEKILNPLSLPLSGLAVAEHSMVIEVPSFAIGKIIGGGGSTIQYLQAKHRVRIRVEQDESLNFAEVTLEGDNEARVDSAKEALESIIQSAMGSLSSRSRQKHSWRETPGRPGSHVWTAHEIHKRPAVRLPSHVKKEQLKDKIVRQNQFRDEADPSKFTARSPKWMRGKASDLLDHDVGQP